jgi:hypothetical protein
VENWKNVTNFQNSVRKKSFGGTFSFSNCHIIGLKLNAREKTLGAGEKLEDFETHFRIKWC